MINIGSTLNIKVATNMNRSNTEEFIAKAKKIHKDVYDYSLVEYITAKSKVKIVCNKHGTFEQTPNGHLNGWGCRKCAQEERGKRCRRSKNDFVKLAKSIHGNLYDYSEVEYINDSTKVNIICKVHGKFSMTPTNHIYGKQGCRSCNMSASKQQDTWLDDLGVSDDIRNKKVVLNDGSYILADAYDKKSRTVYEYWGDYWHGNPRQYDSEYINPHCKVTMGELFNRTQLKRRLILESGFNLIEIWESEFVQRNKRNG